MPKFNMWDGVCSVCRVPVRPGEGVVEADADARRGWVILCPEHMPADPSVPKSPEASRLPSIHDSDERFER